MWLRYIISKRQHIITWPCVICFVRKTRMTMCDVLFGKTRRLGCIILQVCCHIILLTSQTGTDMWILQVDYWITKTSYNSHQQCCHHMLEFWHGWNPMISFEITFSLNLTEKNMHIHLFISLWLTKYHVMS